MASRSVERETPSPPANSRSGGRVALWPEPARRLLESIERIGVQLDAEAGALRQRELAVDELELVGHEIAPQSRLGHLLRHVLEERHMPGHSGEVRRGGDRYARLPTVRDDEPLSFRRELADTASLGEPADAADIRLHDLHSPAVHQVEEFEPCREPLACGDGDRRAPRQLCVAVEVVGPEWCLDEED